MGRLGCVQASGLCIVSAKAHQIKKNVTPVLEAEKLQSDHQHCLGRRLFLQVGLLKAAHKPPLWLAAPVVQKKFCNHRTLKLKEMGGWLKK